MTHRERARSDGRFRDACSVAGIPKTKRQASKYMRQRGKAAQVTDEQIEKFLKVK